MAIATAALAFSAALTATAAAPNPERVVLTPTEDPETEQAITWRAPAEVTDAVVQIHEAGGFLVRTVPASTGEIQQGDDEAYRSFSAVVDDLSPATTYRYRVSGDGSFGDWSTFTTADEPGVPFTFIYFGDAQNGLAGKWAPTVTAAFERFPNAALSVHAGDLVSTSDQGEWTDWFDAMAGYGDATNVLAVPGNHEPLEDADLTIWRSSFTYPSNAPTASPSTSPSTSSDPAARQRAAYEEYMIQALMRTVYYTDYQGVRFVTLDATRGGIPESVTPPGLPECEDDCPDPEEIWLDLQAEWLEQVLAENPNRWSVVTFHEPVFSAAVGRDEEEVRDSWLPILQEHDVDLVLMGHDHTYARGFVDDDATGTPGLTTGPVYAVSVSGPKYYEQEPEDDNVWTRNGATQVVRAEHTSTFQGITVTEDTLTYESIVAANWDDQSTADMGVGGTLDEFTITKCDDGTKWVAESGVEVPPCADDGAGEGDSVDPGRPEIVAGADVQQSGRMDTSWLVAAGVTMGLGLAGWRLISRRRWT